VGTEEERYLNSKYQIKSSDNPIKKQIHRKKFSQGSVFYFETLPRLFFFTSDIQHKLEDIIKTDIHNPKIFEIAFIHRSFLAVLQREFPELKIKDTYSNERLEFLGDSIFNYIITESIFQTYPDSNEGDLTSLRANLINRQVMSEVAYKLHLDKFIQVSFNVQQHIENRTTAVLSNTLESLVGAIYIDSGYESTKNFVLNIVLPLLSEIHAYEIVNYKSKLMEIVQAMNKPAPSYSVIAEEGPPNNRIFFVGVYLDGMLWGNALGTTKKEAEQISAKNALKYI
jgi:ribonuclease-3